MEEEWIVRVEGREYGPVDVDTLREWQREGHLIPDNAVRKEGDSVWITASEIPGVFPVALIQQPQSSRRGLAQIIAESFRLYRRGFRHFFVLTLVTALPSICAQLCAPALDLQPNSSPDLHTAMVGGFSFLMLLLTLVMWPVFIAGIQIMTADLMAARSVRTFELLQRAMVFWPPVALLCIFVYGSYLFWTVLPLTAILAIAAVAGPSLISFFLILLLLAFQVWVTARLFTNFLFWQQFAVITGSNIADTLRQSKELGRSGRDRPWYQRPLWCGAVLASLWCALVIVLNIGPEWQLVRAYFHQLTISQDPQAMLQALSSAKPGATFLSIPLGLLQVVLRPLLGISFVVLYYEARARSDK